MRASQSPQDNLSCVSVEDTTAQEWLTWSYRICNLFDFDTTLCIHPQQKDVSDNSRKILMEHMTDRRGHLLGFSSIANSHKSALLASFPKEMSYRQQLDHKLRWRREIESPVSKASEFATPIATG